MPLDGIGADAVAHQLCRAQIERFLAALNGEPLLVACTQEQPLFEEKIAEHRPGTDVIFTNIRERAGWSYEAAEAHPKITALLAEAALPLPRAPAVTQRSQGAVLIYGRDEAAIEAGRRLMDRLDVTVVLTKPKAVTPPRATAFPVVKGTIRNAAGHLGAFELVVDDFAHPSPSSRHALTFGPGRDGAKSRCDLILDLSGGTPLFPAHAVRDGYLRPDPRRPADVEQAIMRAADLVGEFDKPRYVTYVADRCAHSRSRRVGCTRCLDTCPTGAIRPNGDHVAIDVFVCAGCGACGTVCPTSAATHTLAPPDTTVLRLRTLLRTYAAAGGQRPVILVHDHDHGEPLIDMLARHGDGLPARVIPLALDAVSQFGLEAVMAAFAYGAAELRVLADPRWQDGRPALAETLALSGVILDGLGFGADRVGVIETADPDALGAALADLPPRDGVSGASFLPLGDKRALARLALGALHEAAVEPSDILELPAGAPFGGLVVDTQGCTLCLACAQVCPTGALTTGTERPELRFTEAACVQCGLCRATCPEKVIALAPRLNFGDDARRPLLVKEEEPALCIRCGKPFGTRASIDRIVEKLAGRHWMYGEGSAAIERIRMCGDCRVIAQIEAGDNPLAGPPRPVTRTADDYRH
ncbi:MAG TPA: 4Fe-4S binding protein [Azospirillaceae bacterium]|nr:4Fe-4S binding protein [Azospirillaceae bacterium]